MKPIVLLACVCAISCCSAPEKFGNSIAKDEQLFPKEWKHQEVTLTLAGVDIPAKVELKSTDTEREVKIFNGDVLLESEQYSVSAEGIGLKSFGPAEGETYDPPIPLVKQPMTVGEKIEWSGTYNVHDRRIPATATTETVVEQLPLATGAIETLRCQVDLLIDDGSKQNVKRTVIVWFAKGLGPVKRDFGKQVRAPRVESSEGGKN